LQEMTSAEMTGWLAYLQVDDEVRAQRAAYSIVKAFNGDKGQKQKPAKRTVEDEEVIDTTDPKFAEQFQGFTYAKPQPPRRPQQGNTEILFG
jgi:hypothetical protein